ncbi:hypothetical protein GVN18_30545 [Pseudomonas sp. ODNR1LW]|nr:hypothetical protein [Pseudomonas sp. ODNR1LW]
MRRPSTPRPGRDRGGWRAFALGMAGMFLLIALWVAVFKTSGRDQGAEIQAIGRAQTQADRGKGRRRRLPI